LGLAAEAVEERVRDRTGFAGADAVIVDLDDRDDFARGTRQKRLVGAEQVLVAQDLLAEQR